MRIGILSYTILFGVIVSLLTGCSKKDNLPGPVSDIEGNSYNTIQVGDQVWMAENLKTSSLSDGTQIPAVTNAFDWNELTSPGLCWYNNDENSNKTVYGTLYNYYTVNSGKLCPAGWHVPLMNEWEKLRDFLGDTISGGGKLKEEGILHWKTPNTGATNSTRFTALPAGIRYFEGSFNSISFFTSYWSSTEDDNDTAWYMSLYFSNAVAAFNKTSKKDGFSVRCIKN